MSDGEKIFPTKIPFIRRKENNPLDGYHFEDEDILEEDILENVEDIKQVDSDKEEEEEEEREEELLQEEDDDERNDFSEDEKVQPYDIRKGSNYRWRIGGEELK